MIVIEVLIQIMKMCNSIEGQIFKQARVRHQLRLFLTNMNKLTLALSSNNKECVFTSNE